MFRTHPLEAVFSLIFTPQRDLTDRRDAGTFYIGLGDEFDDDRRLVHAHWSGHICRTEFGVEQNADRKSPARVVTWLVPIGVRFRWQSRPSLS